MKRRVLAGTGLSLGASLLTGATAQAATFVVDRSDDTGTVSTCSGAANDCNLRGAVAASNTSVGTYDDIVFASSITGVTLTGGELSITDGAYIYGNGANATSISGNNASRIFSINPAYNATVNFSYLTLTAGNAGSGSGGAIYNDDANLNIFGSALTGNTAQDGGAIYESGHNYDGYNTDVVATTISGNTASDDGGGFYAYDTPGQIFGSTFSGNTAAGTGGGLYMNFNYVAGGIYDTTVSGNTSADGGGIYVGNPYVFTLNTIVANNSAAAAPDLSGGVYAGFSLLENTSGTTLDSSSFSTITGQDPQLGALQNNGGSTPTLKPAAGSPVVDQGYSYAYYDQRGFDRIVDNPNRANATTGPYAAADIGSVELTLAEGPQAPQPGPAPTSPPGPTFNLKKAIKKCKKKFPGKQNAQRRKKCIKKAKRRAQASGSPWRSAASGGRAAGYPVEDGVHHAFRAFRR